MIVDTSALMAILLDEPDAALYARTLAGATSLAMSAATWVEAAIVVEAHSRGQGGGALDALIRQAGIRIEPVTEAQAYTAREATLNFGRGRHPASLNMGDCFSYALAKCTGEPLLFKGEYFARTDVSPAITGAGWVGVHSG